MKKYEVRGEYGPCHADYITKEITADSPDQAKKYFEGLMRAESPYRWERMRYNVYVRELS